MRTFRWATRQIPASTSGDDRLAVFVEGGYLYIVLCDGAGGIPGGARAADLAVAGLVRGLPDDPVALLAEWDRRLEDDPLAGETTAIVLRMAGGDVSGASCGDSAAFLDGQDLTENQHRKRRLGSGRAAPVPFSGAGQRVLVCSDGLSAFVRPNLIAEDMTIRSLEAAAKALIRRVRLPDGGWMDDLSLVLAESS